MSRHRRKKMILTQNSVMLEVQAKQPSGARCQLPEDVLTLSILENAPFTVWACRRTFEIVLWNMRCETRYACPKEHAIGRNFFDLFVHEHERDQAKKDCLSIIDDGATFVNFIADDHDATGKPMRMLTNCFRVFDDRYKEYVQAEIGVDISDLRVSEERQRTIQEVGRRMQEMKLQNELMEVMLTRMNLKLKLRDTHYDKIRAWQTRHDALLDYIRAAQEQTSPDGKRILNSKVEESGRVKASIENRFNSLDSMLSDARTSEEVDKLRVQIDSFGEWTLPSVLQKG